LIFGTMKKASFAATIASPALVFVCVVAFDPHDAWSPLGSMLVAPLVIAVSVIAVLLCTGRAHVHRHRNWNDA
jgi:predicted permease